MVLTKCLLVVSVLTMFVPPLEARKGTPDSEAVIECMLFFACQCHGEAEAKLFQGCFDLFIEKTKEWAINMVNNRDICPVTYNFTRDFRVDRQILCSLDPEMQKSCMIDGNMELKKYLVDLNLNPSLESMKEQRGILDANECFIPAYQRCNEFPGSCME